MSAREDVLARIAAAHRSAPPPELAYEAIVRDYRRTSTAAPAELAERLVDRLLDYRALVRRCPVAGVADAISAALAERGVRSLAVPPGLPPNWLAAADVDVLSDAAFTVDQLTVDQLTVDQLDGVDAVLTGCAVAIAETGTLILDGGAGMGRRVLSLIPDYHLCVVRSEQIVADVPQALERLDPVRPLTMISGPSATSDIELDRVEGVHGPRTLEVILV